MASALMIYHLPPTHIVVSGTLNDKATKDMIAMIQTTLMPNKVLILADGQKDSILYQNMKVLNDVPTDQPGRAYICEDHACSAPINTLDELSNILRALT